MTAELVVLAPVLIVFVLLLISLGRYESARQQVNGAARAGADAAAVVASPAGAQAAALAAAEPVVAAKHSCAQLGVTADVGSYVPGGFVRVTVTCRVDFSDLAVPGLPGGVSVTAVQTAPIDPYRSVR